MLPFGRGKKFLSNSRVGDALLGGWSITPVVTLQSGFPIGVSQNVDRHDRSCIGGTQRPNIVPGQTFIVDGDITDRITREHDRQPVSEQGGVLDVGAETSSATRRACCRACSRRGGTTSTSRSARTSRPAGRPRASVRLEVLNMFNIVQWAAPASSAFGNSSFGQITNQANNARMIQFTLRLGF